MSEEIEITDLGPVKHLKFPVPEEGGIVILEGFQGTGKSQVIEAIRSLASKEGSIAVRDGAPRAEISAFGATLRMARRLSRLGALEVNTIEGRLSIAELVDPQIHDPAAADAKRIKSLLYLSGAKADAALFYPLAGGQALFDNIVPKAALDTDDLVVMAGNVKRALEKASRDAATKAEADSNEANAARLAWKDVDLKASADEDALREAHNAAVRAEARLEVEATAARKAREERKKAEEALAKNKSEYKGKTVATATDDLEAANTLVVGADELVSDLRARLEAAEKDALEKRHKSELARAALEEAETYEMGLSALQSIIDQELPPEVSITDLDKATHVVAEANEAVQTGGLVRKAQEGLKRAAELKQSSVLAEKMSIEMRDAALATDTVLSAAVQVLECPLYVSGGRLMIKTADRGEELFDDLSHGEKCKVALRIAIKAVGPGGIVPIPQDFWEGLAPKSKREIAAEFENTGVIGITAQATDDPELTARQFEAFPIG